MSQDYSFGPILIGACLVMVIVGLLAWSRALAWFGLLPGDIRIQRPGVRVYAPGTSMLLVSILLSAIASLIGWLRS
jgi:hypothetical protein